MTQAVVLLSGGLDSSTLLWHVAKTLGPNSIFALSFDYGQKHVKEMACASFQAQQVGAVEHHRITLSCFRDLIAGASALTDAHLPIPSLDALTHDQLDQPPTYVPNRNMALLSLACAYAEAKDCQQVYYGAQLQDQYGYWDCTVKFLERLNATLALNRRKAVQVLAPFATLKKADIITQGLALGVDYSQTWSCYRGAAAACGVCPTCVERLLAFEQAGCRDPVVYEADTQPCACPEHHPEKPDKHA